MPPASTTISTRSPFTEDSTSTERVSIPRRLPAARRLVRVRSGSAPSDLFEADAESGSLAEPGGALVEPGRPLRAWQRQALEAYERSQRGAELGSSDFLVTATPGAGKTSFALTLAARLLGRRVVD